MFFILLFHLILVFSCQLKRIAETLINNTQGRQLEAFRCQPDQTLHNILLSGVVVHAAVTILTRSTLDIMQPLFKMMENPGDLKVST